MKKDGHYSAYYIGLDVGQLQDYTALSVIGAWSTWHPARPYSALHGEWRVSEYHVNHLSRFDLGTPYLVVARGVRKVQAAGAFQGKPIYTVVDTTGVGLPVFEMLESEGVRGLIGVTITAGNVVTQDGIHYGVPKRDLVSALQVLFQNRLLRFAKGIPLKNVAEAELKNFRAKINLKTGHDTYEAWRKEGANDDVVLSLALPSWFATRSRALTGSYLIPM